ncbi:hypothetical protein TruAng_004638 [Truncatella angustata]|nr:hypothetical protein TruAng_004638 [Truncatella angustata]
MLPDVSSGVILAFVSTLFIIGSYIYSWNRLRHIPGPVLARWSYLWILVQSQTGHQGARYQAVSEKYGHLTRIGPNDLITDDPDIIRRMSAARSAYKRSSWYDAMRLNPLQHSLFSLTDTATHDRLKAQMSHGYGGKENPTLEDEIDEQLANLLGLIRRKYISSEKVYRPIDLATAVQYFTLDSLTRIAYGKEFGYLETDSDVHSYIKTSESFLPIIVFFAELPFFSRIFFSPSALKLYGPKATDKEGIGRLIGIAKEVVNKRFENNAEDQQDMLGSFIRHGVPQELLEGEVPFQIIAGSDTTATTIRGTMLNLMTTPHAYQALQKEIDAAIAQGLLSNPARADEGRQLEYLQAVIYEGLRINIPFTGLAMKEVPPEGDTIHGHFVPGGTRIAWSITAIERSKELFGEDAELFRPERWLNIEPNKKREMVQTVELVFGYGRWGCAGKPVAFMELNKVYIEVSVFDEPPLFGNVVLIKLFSYCDTLTFSWSMQITQCIR